MQRHRMRGGGGGQAANRPTITPEDRTRFNDEILQYAIDYLQQNRGGRANRNLIVDRDGLIHWFQTVREGRISLHDYVQARRRQTLAQNGWDRRQSLVDVEDALATLYGYLGNVNRVILHHMRNNTMDRYTGPMIWRIPPARGIPTEIVDEGDDDVPDDNADTEVRPAAAAEQQGRGMRQQRANPWVQHVRQMAATMGMSYGEALRHPRVRSAYSSRRM